MSLNRKELVIVWICTLIFGVLFYTNGCGTHRTVTAEITKSNQWANSITITFTNHPSPETQQLLANAGATLDDSARVGASCVYVISPVDFDNEDQKAAIRAADAEGAVKKYIRPPR